MNKYMRVFGEKTVVCSLHYFSNLTHFAFIYGYVTKLKLIPELHIEIRFYKTAVLTRKPQSNALNVQELFLTWVGFSRRETTAVLAKHRAKAPSLVAYDS